MSFKPSTFAYVSFDASKAGDFSNDDIICSHNVSGVTREGKGLFSIAFTNSHSTGNYVSIATAGSEDYSGSGASPRACGIYSRSTTEVKVVVERTDDSVNEDNSYVNLMVLG